MGETTSDKQSSTTKSKEDLQKRQGWIRMHSDADESGKASSIDEVDNPEKSAAQPHDRKVRKLENPIE